MAWDSLLFDYTKYEVQRFLLSNVRYWLEEFRFDGFRFDGVTSMLYLDHGLGKAFSSYDDYFDGNVDPMRWPICNWPMKWRTASKPDCITIAEDVSGMVGMARPVDEGGHGFRLSPGDGRAGLLDQDAQGEAGRGMAPWRDLAHAAEPPAQRKAHRLCREPRPGAGRRQDAGVLADGQGDVLAHGHDSQNIVVDRGIALHKMIRLITFSLAGEGYLNFMGNEFGHPEWVDFPREGNNFSYQYARRQWSLVDNEKLRYHGLTNFDQAMMKLDIDYHMLDDPLIEQLALHEDTRQLVYRRGPLVFVFNFHPSESYSGLRIPVPDRADYKLVLNTDAARFSGPGLVDETSTYPWQDVPMYGRSRAFRCICPAVRRWCWPR